MNSTATDMRSFTAPVGTAARTRWSATAAFGSHTQLAAIKPMPSSYVVKTNGIRHRPPEDSN